MLKFPPKLGNRLGSNTMILLAMKFVFWRANRIRETKALMKRWNRKVQFDIESVSPFYIMFQESVASLAKGRAEEPDLIIKASINHFRKILKGEVRFEEAFLRKQFEATGSIHDAARFSRIVGVVLESHKRALSTFRRLFGKFI